MGAALQRREFLAAAAGALPAARTAAPPALNFVLILIDDMGWRDLSCYGSTFHQTPNLDRLAAAGVRFTNAYAACPVCSPTRASIMTGKYPARLQLTDWIPGRKQWPAAKLLAAPFRQELPLEEITIAERLRAAGYATGYFGKWHLSEAGFNPEAQGFDRSLFERVGIQRRPKWQVTEQLTQAAESFIEQNRSRPFFLYVSHFAVHGPAQAPPDAIARYRSRITAGDPQRNPVYAAMVESVDASLERIVRKLDATGTTDRTVIFFTSDNGGLIYEGDSREQATSNLPLRAGKGHVYEGGIRVPLIVKGPGIAKRRVCDVPVSSVDYFPTILEMAGLAGAHVDGRSIGGLLTGRRGGPARDALFWHYPHYSNQGGVPAGAVREDEYKLIEFYEDGRLELFNLAQDLSERKNLARRLPDKAAELHALLKNWRKELGAAMPAPNPAYDARSAGQGLTGAEPPTEPLP